MQDVAGLDAVHGDVLARELEGGGANEAVHAALGGRIVRGAGHGDVRAGHRRGEQEPPAALLAQMRKRRLNEPEARLEIDGERAVEILVRQLIRSG